MAYNEQKASLPPIIEDESDDNLMPMLYRKELGRSDNKNEERTVLQSTAHSNTGNIFTASTQIPYNSWKSMNAAYLKSPETVRDSSDMQSKLGQTLESCPTMISPHLKQASGNVNHVYQQGMDSPGYKAGSEPADDRGRYFGSGLENQNLKQFTNPGNTAPRGYFPQHSSPYREHMYNSQHHLRMFTPDFTHHDSFKFPQVVERSFNPSNISPSGFEPGMGSPDPYRLHNTTPSHFHSQGFQNEITNPMSCQSSCCRTDRPGPPHEAHNYQAGKITAQPIPGYQQEIPRRHLLNSSHKNSSCHCHEDKKSKSKNRETKSEKDRSKQITDLYRIVWLQNQQIMELQTQVKKLIELYEKFDEKSKKLDQDHTTKVLSKGEKRMFNLSVIEENQNLMEKVSVGIMTSFIDSSTMKTKGKSKKSKSNPQRPSKSSASSSTSSSESSTQISSEDEEIVEALKKSKIKKKKNLKPLEDSILLNGLEIATIAENEPSPNSSPLRLEMQEFGSSSDSDESGSSEGETGNAFPVGWTFYDKVVGKVNNMLNKSESDDDSGHDVRSKTLEQLRKLGINLIDQDCSPSSKRVTFDSPYQPRALAESDTSMRMNALAMKYLKEERLSRETPEKPEKEKKTKKKKEKRSEEKAVSKKKSRSGHLSGKILDITAIKQQPKLLPKRYES